MINDAFYPTPRSVISKMIAPLMNMVEGRYYLHSKQILEPSAGKGDILDYITSVHNIPKANVFCVENDPELQMILSGKGYKLIDTDFLKYDERYHFDVILMNPPFADGADHLLKAWEILTSGDIVCILNAETILNPYTEKRQLLRRIIQDHGRYEIIGNAFATAERKTDVNCAIVWLKKSAKDNSVPFDETGFEFASAVDESEFTANPLAHSNIVQSLVDQYNHAAKILAEIHGLESKYRFYTNGIIDFDREERKASESLNVKIDDLKSRFWKYIFDKTKLGQVATSNFRNKFDEFAAQTSRLAFSEANIMHVLEMFFLNRDQIIKDCIVEVFDKATAYHEKNTIHTEGWKTNKSWKIAGKVIMPNGVVHEPKWNGWHIAYGGRSRDFFADFDKALCFISGKKLEDIHTTVKAIEDRLLQLSRGMRSTNHDSLFESTFFTIRIFKKGTVHLTFKDADLLARFNQIAAQNKNWVGSGEYKKTAA